MAMPAETQDTMSEHGAIDAQMTTAMATDMPCCPDKAPDCGKDCPLMALCMVSVLQSAPLGPVPIIPLTRASVVIPGEDADLSGLA